MQARGGGLVSAPREFFRWDARLRFALTALQGAASSGQNSQGQGARRGQALQLQDALVLLSVTHTYVSAWNILTWLDLNPAPTLRMCPGVERSLKTKEKRGT